MQGGVSSNDVVVADPELEIDPEDLHGAVLQIGKRRFLRIT